MMPTIPPTGLGAPPSAVILAFPVVSPKTRAVVLFRKALQASMLGGADDLDAFDAVIGEAIDTDPARVAEAILANGEMVDEMRRVVAGLEASEAVLAASVIRALKARGCGGIQPLGAAETASLRDYLVKVAGVDGALGA